MNEKRQQVVDQCRVVAHLAKAILEVYSDKARVYAHDIGESDAFIDFLGNVSARHMEKLGDILNGMDAVEDEDEWTGPIFEKAHQFFPQANEAPQSSRGNASE
jgi:hypothetical protein